MTEHLEDIHSQDTYGRRGGQLARSLSSRATAIAAPGTQRSHNHAILVEVIDFLITLNHNQAQVEHSHDEN